MKRALDIKKMILVLLVLTITFSLVACGNKEENIDETESEETRLSYEDDYGRMISLDKYPERIISLSPSNTEILFALGLNDEIIGVTEYCDYPEAALEKETIGGFDKSDAEKIISLKPDLVIGSGDPNEKLDSILRDADIPTLSYDSKNIEEIISQIERIGEITNRSEEAEKIIKEMKNRRDTIVEKVKDQEKIRVFYEVWPDPLTAAGEGSFMNELIELSGGDNITKDSKKAYPEIDPELLIDRNPEIYLTTMHNAEKEMNEIKERPGYHSIDAVKNGRIYFLDSNIASRPGPRIIEALEMVAKKIHPEVFED